MSESMQQIIQSFARVNVLVVGDALLDTYLEGVPGRLCREAPVPLLDLIDRKDMPGGAGNTAVNLRALGAQTTLLSVTGADNEGNTLRKILERSEIASENLVLCEKRGTCAKNRLYAGKQMTARFDLGTRDCLSPETAQALIQRLDGLFRSADAVIISDYGCGVVTGEVIEHLCKLQEQSPRLMLVDSRNRLSDYRNLGATVVKPNYEEALMLLGFDGAGPAGEKRAEKILPFGEEILSLTGTHIAAVSMDSDGALIFEKGREPYRTYGSSSTNSYSAGAGDTFAAAFTLALATGSETTLAAEIASAAAAVVVAKEGTAACSQHELLARVSYDGKYITDLGRLVLILEAHRKQGRRIVFTNGCFDILHRGHITYLNRAKNPGDIMVVGVNSDSSVQRLKGPERPINTLEDRVKVLSALSCVDYLAAFDGQTASDLVRVVRPDVFVKGGDYTKDRLPEAPVVEELGGVVRILPFLDNRSTTRIIEKVQKFQSSRVQG
ncbi:MAG: D-glycero-beta-D-manno-heptose 1-phosphate adenylyltransferase [Acidobacteria bacterium]|nr:MAG: D-glycero-beta-D-manno-heptose 1-phosphate adenylyltransferase [Acidobacteriota bacterium]